MATLSICPATTVAAPVERVWELLGDPHQYATWWDARTERIAPEGPAVAGQTISASARALGKRWPVRLRVEQVDAERRQIRLTTLLPFLGLRSTMLSPARRWMHHIRGCGLAETSSPHLDGGPGWSSTCLPACFTAASRILWRGCNGQRSREATPSETREAIIRKCSSSPVRVRTEYGSVPPECGESAARSRGRVTICQASA